MSFTQQVLCILLCHSSVLQLYRVKVNVSCLFVCFLQKSRYEVYMKILDSWQSIETSQSTVGDKLHMFDEGLWRGETNGEEDETEGVMKRSLSSPSLEFEAPAQPVVKVRRNISERRTYRKIVIPRRNKELWGRKDSNNQENIKAVIMWLKHISYFYSKMSNAS